MIRKAYKFCRLVLIYFNRFVTALTRKAQDCWDFNRGQAHFSPHPHRRSGRSGSWCCVACPLNAVLERFRRQAAAEWGFPPDSAAALPKGVLVLPLEVLPKTRDRSDRKSPAPTTTSSTRCKITREHVFTRHFLSQKISVWHFPTPVTMTTCKATRTSTGTQKFFFIPWDISFGDPFSFQANV